MMSWQGWMPRHWHGKRRSAQKIMGSSRTQMDKNTTKASYKTQDQLDAEFKALKLKLVDELKLTKQISSLEIKKRSNPKQIGFALGELFGHGYLYTQILRTPEHLIEFNGSMLYRVFYVTQKFLDAIEKGEKIE